jgi:predicted ATPase
MAVRPSGTVTFLFTDIEGSTRRWESDPDGMASALAAHDRALGEAIEIHHGWLFKHTGDGVCAAFSSAPHALRAAIEAQRRLALPVRMGIGTGLAERRGDDYFGTALNRAARVMAAGHGGQILVGAATAALADGFDLLDLGEHSLRDLSGVHRIFQVRADGLVGEFPPLRTLAGVAGNLPVQTTSFVGRQAAVDELIHEVHSHRLVTLTGVGGVGKTRLAVQVAARMASEFPDGVWLVELASVGDSSAVPDAVAMVLGVRAPPGTSVSAAIAPALAGRRLLLVLDNCEHVLDAAAGLVEMILAGTTATKVIATSREGLRVGPEWLWPVPPLGVSGEHPEAVDLFVERARAVNARLWLADNNADADVVARICERLEGIPLAIELAAARMLSMSPRDVNDRLSDQFRLLGGGRRGVERHQTLRNVVAWSYELLDVNEQTVLGCCAVFAGGFDQAAVINMCDTLDEYTVLDVLDSLVRKSLVTADHGRGHVRYRMLEIIRQFADQKLAVTDQFAELRDRHAGYYAAQAIRQWQKWDGPAMRAAMDWVDVEMANLRAGFRWATERDDLGTATAVAAHTASLAFFLMRYEPAGWALEILDAATRAEVTQLPRLYTAAAQSMLTGRPLEAVGYAETAIALGADSHYDGFDPAWSRIWNGVANQQSPSGLDRALDIFRELAADPQPGLGLVAGLSMLTWLFAGLGRADEARTIAGEAVAAARAYGHPHWIGVALMGTARAFTDTDPLRALHACREAIGVTRQTRNLFLEVAIASWAAGLEVAYGDPNTALELFDFAVDVSHRTGARPSSSRRRLALAHLAVFLGQIDEPTSAATLYGASSHSPSIGVVPGLPDLVHRLRDTLGEAMFEQSVASGAAMELEAALAYGRQRINLAIAKRVSH